MDLSAKSSRLGPLPGAGECVALNTIHPLLIDVILDKVLKLVLKSKEVSSEFCEEVKRLRLVCKLWNLRTTSIFRSRRAPITFGWHLTQFLYGKLDMSGPVDRKLSKFCDEMSASNLIPVEHYIIRETIFQPVNKQLISHFAQLCLPSTVSLELSLENFSFFYSLGIGNRFSRLNLDKLKKLDITCVLAGNLPESMNGRCPFPSILSTLLKAARNLEEFGFQIVNSENSAGILFQICQQVPKSVKKLRLQNNNLSEYHMHVLTQSELQLEELTLSFGYCNKEMGPVMAHKFFKKQSKTLKKLDLHLENDSLSLLSGAFPTMNEVHSLKLNSVGDEPILMVQIFLENMFPNLEVLNLEHFTNSRENFYGDLWTCLITGAAVSSVKELTLPQNKLVTPMLIHVPEIFPNLCKLQIILPEGDTREYLKMIFSDLAELEELSIQFPDMRYHPKISGDSSFSGVPEESLQQIIKRSNFDQENLRRFQRAPSILNLKMLKRLTLKCSEYQKIPFTNFSAHFLFLRMPELEELRLNQFDISPYYEYSLRSKLKVLETSFFA